MKINDNTLNAMYTIWIAFAMRIYIFLTVKEGEPGDGQERGPSDSERPQAQQAQSQTITCSAPIPDTHKKKRKSESNTKFNYDAFDTFLNVLFRTILIDLSISMSFSLIVFGIISNCMNNYDASLTLTLTLIMNATIVATPNDLDTIVGLVGGIFTLLAIRCGAGNNSKTDHGASDNEYNNDKNVSTVDTVGIAIVDNIDTVLVGDLFDAQLSNVVHIDSSPASGSCPSYVVCFFVFCFFVFCFHLFLLLCRFNKCTCLFLLCLSIYNRC